MREDIGVLPTEAQVIPVLTCDGRPHATDHQTLSWRLPQAQALEAGHDFLEDIRQLVVVGDETEAEPVKAGLRKLRELTGDCIRVPHR
jgi:hypothetical protein